MKQDKKAAVNDLVVAFVFFMLIPFVQEMNAAFLERLCQGLMVFFMVVAIINALPDSPPKE